MSERCAEHPEDPRWRALVSKARTTNSTRDHDDRKAGWAAPSASLFLLLRTGLEAVSTGLCCEDWDCVAEGFVMLQELEHTLRPELLLRHNAGLPL
jgi:hypothetical protein